MLTQTPSCITSGGNTERPLKPPGSPLRPLWGVQRRIHWPLLVCAAYICRTSSNLITDLYGIQRHSIHTYRQYLGPPKLFCIFLSAHVTTWISRRHIIPRRGGTSGTVSMIHGHYCLLLLQASASLMCPLKHTATYFLVTGWRRQIYQSYGLPPLCLVEKWYIYVYVLHVNNPSTSPP